MARDYELLKASGPTIYDVNGNPLFSAQNPAHVTGIVQIDPTQEVEIKNAVGSAVAVKTVGAETVGVTGTVGVNALPALPASSAIIGTVRTQALTGAVVNKSMAVPWTGVSTSVLPANTARKYLYIQNTSAGNIWLNFTGAANKGQPSIYLKYSERLVFDTYVPTGAMTAMTDTVGTAGQTMDLTILEA